MRILVLTIEYPPLGGGASPMIHEINKQYLKLGHQVTVITMSYHQLPDSEWVDGIEIIRVKSVRAHKHISNFWEHCTFIISARKFLKSYLRKQAFDLCHAHFMVPTGLIATWVKRKFRIPFIVTVHGSDVPGFNPDRFIYLHLFTPPVIRSVFRKSTYVISPSLYLESLLVKTIGPSSEKIIHIPNGIDTGYFVPGQKKDIILSTGRLLPRKGFQYLVDVISAKPYPYTLHICGDGPMKNQLHEQAKQSLTPIYFHGWLDNKSEEYRQLLAEASIFCLVSSKENASISLLEALSSGCVVITSDVSGCPETVADAGIIIPPADPLALESALHSLLQDSVLMTTYMQKARERAVREYTWLFIAEKYNHLFSTMHKS